MDSTILTNPEFEYNPKPVSCKVDSLTWLIRVPSCSTDYHEWTIKALQQFDESNCENLIIDVRGNGGGSDGVWNSYYDMLYDHPNKPYISWFRNTPENINQWKIFAMKCQYEKDFSKGLGIVPDVIIPLSMPRKFTDNIDEWVLWVALLM